eukprot:GHVU01066846.1.p1 GENE.GHVU01066846.1~~GHVU01066846.1.p1  ORF type:complete len:245 (+),score=45.35 GHVU01066846.1:336-1070(+)
MCAPSAAEDPPPAAGCLQALWTLLYRYQTLCGSSGREGSGWHLATPPEVFKAATEAFQVTHECFASPFNCTPPNSFCSVFKDTDAAFGSAGSFFRMSFKGGGSFECGPPYDVGVISRVADVLLRELRRAEQADEALSFFVVVPHWSCSGLQRLRRSRAFFRHGVCLRKNSHFYVNGFQQFAHCADRFMRVQSLVNTELLWLQTTRGHARWAPTPQRVSAVVEAWTGSGTAAAAAAAAKQLPSEQ